LDDVHDFISLKKRIPQCLFIFSFFDKGVINLFSQKILLKKALRHYLFFGEKKEWRYATAITGEKIGGGVTPLSIWKKKSGVA
jgi:hypothetical protein